MSQTGKTPGTGFKNRQENTGKKFHLTIPLGEINKTPKKRPEKKKIKKIKSQKKLPHYWLWSSTIYFILLLFIYLFLLAGGGLFYLLILSHTLIMCIFRKYCTKQTKTKLFDNNLLTSSLSNVQITIAVIDKLPFIILAALLSRLARIITGGGSCSSVTIRILWQYWSKHSSAR